MNDKEHFPGSDGSGGSRFQFVQPNRDLQSNWEVDLAKKLEEYLLKICSGEISSVQDHELHSVNFAEAALLLQGSVQVYSRKVEYLYSLVLHALEFLSQKRQSQDENAPNKLDGIESNAVSGEVNELFLGLDDVPVEAKNCLDNGLDKNESSKHLPKPPANLVVLEGDCLDSSGDSSELESYLLATCNFYGDFLLLDPCDARAVYEFSRTNDAGKHDIATHIGSSVRSRTCRSPFNSPTARSGGTAHKSNLGKNQEIDDKISEDNCAFVVNNDPTPGSHDGHDYPDNDTYHADEPNFGFSDDRAESDDDSDDPWKPLNPHEPGNLKLKPFKRIKGFGRHVTHCYRRNTQTSQFPIAKLDGIIGPEFAQSFEVRKHLQEKLHESQPMPLFEKLRRTFISGEQETYDGIFDLDDDNHENGIDDDPPGFSQEEIDLSKRMFDADAEVPLFNTKGDAAAISEGIEAFEHDDLDSHANLEDLCRSHLDSLLASIAETQKQTEMAARVSTWKQRVEDTLEEQETRPPFDIHLYGERILDKVSLEADSGGSISFSNVVKGQPKHDVARTFSALLQLVNNGNVDLQKASSNGELICHTATNPFYIRLCGDGSRKVETLNRSARKRLKSPIRTGCQKRLSTAKAASPSKSAHQNVRSSVRPGKGSVIRLTPDGKRRRRSFRLMEPFDLMSAER
ncbi:hypothetical protein Cni_G01856 [Canna indica]|uniref:Condensin-2 complex subunit H2 n=1 Tax=Canna indica TaxID=4628 RepID=A0AAQ3JPY2_9LILI|nr:hypothetical protein Cni_G01856 [Canna indica]